MKCSLDRKHVDRDIRENRIYQYRVRGEFEKHESVYSGVVEAVVPDIWRIEVVWILPPGGERERTVADLVVHKFERPRGAWVSRRFRLSEGDEIGIEIVNYRSQSRFDGVDWRTGFKVVRLEGSGSGTAARLHYVDAGGREQAVAATGVRK